MERTDCIFCKIVRGEIPCSQVYATEHVLAFLDIAPVRPGHVLVIPKAHHETLFDLPPELGGQLLQAVQVVGRAVLKATGAQGLNVGMNNYAAAGQLVPHAHFHLVPRVENDGLSLWPQTQYASMQIMIDLAALIARSIG